MTEITKVSKFLYIIKVQSNQLPSVWTQAYTDENKAKTDAWGLINEGFKISLKTYNLYDG